ncbi:MAG TPA: HAMP domain-containing sensor histidine kinase [Actinomycetota bacterium]|nr:HAMP domain-containing sensor histidine kinase [Actinomycetota bacterium]
MTDRPSQEQSDALAEKNAFIAVFAHDLKSPMAIIGGFAETLVDSWDRFDDNTRKDFVRRIGKSIASLSKLVDDVLQVTRIEGGTLEYDLVDVDLVALVAEATRDASLGDATARMKTVLAADTPAVRADPDRVWLVLLNLLSNAAKFSSESEIVVEVVPRSGSVEVSVVDRGVGIRPNDLPRVFDKFAAIEPPKGGKPKGTGLGLYICKAIIEAQDGTLTAASEPGEGSTFTFTLPVAGGGS